MLAADARMPNAELGKRIATTSVRTGLAMTGGSLHSAHRQPLIGSKSMSLRGAKTRGDPFPGIRRMPLSKGQSVQ